MDTKRKLIVTTIEPAQAGEDPSQDKLGKVLDCFEVPYDVTEIVLCEDEIAFVTEAGGINFITDASELEDTPCPRCGVAAGGEHTCENPFAAEMAIVRRKLAES